MPIGYEKPGAFTPLYGESAGIPDKNEGRSGRDCCLGAAPLAMLLLG
jgi:hypothetical protein